jgi:hypothetical protein
MACGERRKCKRCLTRVIVATSVTARPPPAERPAKPPAKHAWLAAPENQGYFRGPVNVTRVQAWRPRHPGYWCKDRRVGAALQGFSRRDILVLRSRERSPSQHDGLAHQEGLLPEALELSEKIKREDPRGPRFRPVFFQLTVSISQQSSMVRLWYLDIS